MCDQIKQSEKCRKVKKMVKLYYSQLLSHDILSDKHFFQNSLYSQMAVLKNSILSEEKINLHLVLIGLIPNE